MITVDKKRLPWREGLTVAQVMQMLDDSYDYPAVRIHHQIIPKAKFEQTLVPDDVEILLIPLIAGG